MRQVINKINEHRLQQGAGPPPFGDIYEQILATCKAPATPASSTPRAPSPSSWSTMVDPKLGETVLDPACGTGGFLTCTIEHKRKRYVKTPRTNELQASIRGVEKEAAAAPALRHQHAAARHRHPDQDPPRQHPRPPAARLRPKGPRRRHRHQPALRRHGRGRHRNNFPALPHPRNRRPVPGLIIQLLKDGGRAAVVLPDGTLFGEGIKTRIKENLL
jgi:type I restriction enzyme M protein